MHVIDVMVMAKKVIDIFFYEGNNDCVTSNGDGDGSDGHFYTIENVIHVNDVMAMVMEVMDIVIGFKL